MSVIPITTPRQVPSGLAWVIAQKAEEIARTLFICDEYVKALPGEIPRTWSGLSAEELAKYRRRAEIAIMQGTPAVVLMAENFMYGCVDARLHKDGFGELFAEWPSELIDRTIELSQEFYNLGLERAWRRRLGAQ